MTATLPQSQSPAADLNAAPVSNRPRLPYPVRIALIVVAMLANILITPLILGIPLELIARAVELPQDLLLTLSMITRMAPVPGAILIVWLMMKHIDRRPLREAGLVFTKASLPLGLIGIGVALVAILPAGWLLTNAGLLRPDDSAIASVSPIWTFITAMVLGLFTQGFPEEFLWRGYGLQTMRYRPLTAALVSGIVFGLMHIVSMGGQQNWVEHIIYLLGPIGFGLAASFLTVAARSIWPAVGVHFGNHLAFYLGSLFGMGTGPLLWVAEGVAFLIITAIIYFGFRKQFEVPIVLNR